MGMNGWHEITIMVVVPEDSQDTPREAALKLLHSRELKKQFGEWLSARIQVPVRRRGLARLILEVRDPPSGWP